jgi:cbb3-type cytochrome c oxidase subunit I
MPPRKTGVRHPSVGEAMRARQAEMRARVDALRNKYVEPILLRFPKMLPTKPDSAAKYAIISSMIWFAVALLLALLLTVKLVFPKLLTQFPWMSYGRLAGAEAVVLTWGVLFTGFTGAMFAIVPRLTGTKLWSERIGAQTIVLHDQVVLAGVVLLLLGRTQGINGLELWWPIDILLLNVMLMVVQNVVATIARRKEKDLAPSLWYFLAAVIVLPATYAFGNLAAPWYVGVNQQIVAGFAIAGTMAGITMMGIGTAYYVLPKATGTPIYSERLALIGFWSFVFAAPWIGQIWAIAGPGQDYLETTAITFAVWLVIPALCVLANFWGTLRGAWDRVIAEPALKFVLAGTLFFVLGTVQIAVGSLRTVQNVVGHTAWDIAARDALMGGLGFFLIALVYHQFPRIIGRALYSTRWASRQLWTQVIGLATVVLATSVAGLVQGETAIAGVQTGRVTSSGANWFVTTLATRPLYILRIGGGALVAFGLFMFVANLMRTSAAGEDAEVEPLPFETPQQEPVGASA